MGLNAFSPPFSPFPLAAWWRTGTATRIFFQLQPFGCCITGGTKEGKRWSHPCAEAGLCSAAAKEVPKGSVPMLAAMLETKINVQGWVLGWRLQSCKQPFSIWPGLWDVPCELCSTECKFTLVGTSHFFSSPSCLFYFICISTYRSFQKACPVDLNRKWKVQFNKRWGGKQGKTNSILSYCFCIYLTAVQISSSDACRSTW